MFGYIKAFKPYLRICEYDTYQAIYCGLCKEMGRRTGQASRLTLSYDFTFLAMLEMSLLSIPVKAEKQRCVAHPIKKRLCVVNNKGLEYPADAAAILMHYKLYDNIEDQSLAKAGISKAAMAALSKGYKSAKKRYPELDLEIARQMDRQFEVEKANEQSLDKACDPTALMMQAIFKEIKCDDSKKQALMRFGYALGRVIYIADALDDIKDDCKKGCYNPLLEISGVRSIDGVLTDESKRVIARYCRRAVNLTLAEIADSFMQLELVMYRATLDNIIYVGLPNVFTLGIKKLRKQDNKE